MIPAGTGIRNYRGVKVYDDSDMDLDAQMEEILEQRRIEKELEAREQEERERAAAAAALEMGEEQD